MDSAFTRYAQILLQRSQGESKHDDLGEELPDNEAAWRQATVIAGDVLKDIDGKFRPGQEWSLEVTDDAGTPIYFIHIEARQMT